MLYDVLAAADADTVIRFQTVLTTRAVGHIGSRGATRDVGLDLRPGAAMLGQYSWEVDENVKRRDFGKLAAGTAIALLAGNVGRIGTSDVQRLLNGVDVLYQEDWRIGGASLVNFAVDQLARAKAMLDTCAYDTTIGNAFTSAAGELAVLAGWLAYDADRHPLARRCYADALALGTEADDNNLIAHACLNSANQSVALSRDGTGSPFHALKLVSRARDLLRGRPPGRIHALVAVREAQAYGVLGDRTAFARAIATAWREMDHAVRFEPIDECPLWLRFMNDSEVGSHEARGYGDIGDLTRSVELYGATADELSSARNATNLRAWSAATRAQAGDISGALEEGLPVLDDLAEVASTRTLRVLEPIRIAVDQLAAGSDFRDQFDALTQKAITA
ncbi:hypothetical protein [Nocardia terpenica]|uniref:hypothetical protein n=1 Tax=Nocardia terpenica TaxID=455432 RepID=UPI0012E700A7|nr:hypothetical protein [Nocardia terpenica]NQE89997.1 hypothetical protein [Nocardia terpenica]